MFLSYVFLQMEIGLGLNMVKCVGSVWLNVVVNLHEVV